MAMFQDIDYKGTQDARYSKDWSKSINYDDNREYCHQEYRIVEDETEQMGQ